MRRLSPRAAPLFPGTVCSRRCDADPENGLGADPVAVIANTGHGRAGTAQLTVGKCPADSTYSHADQHCVSSGPGACAQTVTIMRLCTFPHGTYSGDVRDWCAE